MIKIVAKKHVKPENLSLFKQIAKELVEKSGAEEGNIYYTLNESLSEPNTLVYIECWRDKEAVAAHGGSEHFRTLVPKLNELCEDSPAPELFCEIEY